MNRKAALVGCIEGQWIHTADMRELYLNAKTPTQDTEFEVYQMSDLSGVHSESCMRFTGSGRFQLENAAWTKVFIVSGPCAGVLCTLESSARGAA